MDPCISNRQGRRALMNYGKPRAICQPVQPSIQSPKMPQHAAITGGELLDLPEDILYGIAWHFTLGDWAKGPAQACRSLNKLHLPRIILHIPRCQAVSDIYRRRDRLLLGLQWAAGRMGSATVSIEVNTGQRIPDASVRLDSVVQDELPALAYLNSVRPIWSHASVEPLQERFLEHAQHVKAMRLPRGMPYLANFAGRLQHLASLEMDASSFVQGVAQAAGHLPSLQSLYLHAADLDEGVINVLGCQHLKHLVLKGRFAHVRPVLHEPKCRLGIHVHSLSLRHLRSTPQAAVRGTHGGAADLVLHADHAGSTHHHLSEVSGACKHFARVEALTLIWPMHWLMRTDNPDAGYHVAWAEGLLQKCMPADGRPLRSLRALIVVAEGCIDCCIPSGLPQLGKLVLYARGDAKVSFEDPSATFASLKTLYVLGQPLTAAMQASVVRQLADRTARRGLLLSTATATEAGKDFRQGTSCMYLRPNTTPELSLEELYARVSGLARQCRCKACFECLRRAGYPWS